MTTSDKNQEKNLEITRQPQQFYAIIEKMFERRHQNRIMYELTQIPNVLKTNTKNRKITIHEIRCDDQLDIKKIQYGGYPVIIHVAKGRAQIQLIEKHNERIEILKSPSTRLVTDKEVERSESVKIRAGAKTLVMFEIMMPEPTEFSSGNTHNELYQYNITNDDIKHRRSVLRNPYTESDVKKRVIFLDAEFANTTNATFSPVAITILDYKGNTLLDTLCCPREKIRNYETRCHGLNEEQLRGKSDSEDIIQAVQKIVNGKIIVGSDLQMDIRWCRIDIDKISGIRDLSTAKCIRNIMDTEAPYMKLQKMAEIILKEKIQQGFHSSKEDTNTIRKIYLAVEENWCDNNTEVEWIHHYDDDYRATGTSTIKKRTLPNPDSYGKKFRAEQQNLTCDMATQTEKEPERNSIGIQMKIDSNVNVKETQTEGNEMKTSQETQTDRLPEGSSDDEILLAVKKDTMISVKGRNLKIEMNPKKW